MSLEKISKKSSNPEIIITHQTSGDSPQFEAREWDVSPNPATNLNDHLFPDTPLESIDPDECSVVDFSNDNEWEINDQNESCSYSALAQRWKKQETFLKEMQNTDEDLTPEDNGNITRTNLLKDKAECEALTPEITNPGRISRKAPAWYDASLV